MHMFVPQFSVSFQVDGDRIELTTRSIHSRMKKMVKTLVAEDTHLTLSNPIDSLCGA